MQFSSLPPDTLRHTLSFCDLATLLAARRTSPLLRALLNEESKGGVELWQQACRECVEFSLLWGRIDKWATDILEDHFLNYMLRTQSFLSTWAKAEDVPHFLQEWALASTGNMVIFQHHIFLLIEGEKQLKAIRAMSERVIGVVARQIRGGMDVYLRDI